jgi:RNase P subunit RPR2
MYIHCCNCKNVITEKTGYYRLRLNKHVYWYCLPCVHIDTHSVLGYIKPYRIGVYNG